MSNIKYLVFLGLFFSINLSADSTLSVKCKENFDFIKSMRDKGVIKDSSYLSFFDLLSSSKTEPLSKARRQKRVNRENLNQRISEIEKLAKEDVRLCIFFSAELIRDLSDYADIATKSDKGKGLNKFQNNWQAKVYILGKEATNLPAPKDLSPALPTKDQDIIPESPRRPAPPRPEDIPAPTDVSKKPLK